MRPSPSTGRLVAAEGYLFDPTRAGLMLLFSVIDPDPREAVEFGDPVCRLPVAPGVVHRPEAYRECAACAAFAAGYLGTLYADLQLWWQGVRFDPA